MNKIINIPQNKDLFDQLNSVNDRQLTLSQRKKKEKIMRLLMAPDTFNEYFSSSCWISHDYFSEEIMLEAISIYEKSKSIKEVDTFLSNVYSEEFIDKYLGLITCFRGCHLENIPDIGTLFIKHFLDRLEIIENAKQNYISERYHSCVVLLLSVIDGITNDIDHEFGFFTQHCDLTLEDSIVGHETGLPTIQKIVNESRKKTNFEEITIPYRNGILHGRDINYGNKIVAAKCWHILFALHDWAKDNNRNNFFIENKAPIKKEDVDKIVPKEFDKYLNVLFDNLKNEPRNDQLIYFARYPTQQHSKFHRMNELGRLFKGIKFIEFDKLEETSLKENYKTVVVDIQFEYDGNVFSKKPTLLFEYTNFENQLVSLDADQGYWKLDFLLAFNNLKNNCKN